MQLILRPPTSARAFVRGLAFAYAFACACASVACSPPGGGGGGGGGGGAGEAGGAAPGTEAGGPGDAGGEGGTTIPAAVDLACSQWGTAKEWETTDLIPVELAPASRSFALTIGALAWHSKLAAQGAQGDFGYGIGWLPRGLLGTVVVDPTQLLHPSQWGTAPVPAGLVVALVLDGMSYAVFKQVTAIENVAAVQPTAARKVYVADEPLLRYTVILVNESNTWTLRPRYQHAGKARTVFDANGLVVTQYDTDEATTTVTRSPSDVTIRDDYRSLNVKYVFTGGAPPAGLLARIEGPTDYTDPQIDVHLGVDYLYDGARHLTGTREPRTFGQQAAKLTYAGDMVATYTPTTGPDAASVAAAAALADDAGLEAGASPYPLTDMMRTYTRNRPTNGLPVSTLTFAANGDFQRLVMWDGSGYRADYGTANAVGVIGPFERFIAGGAFNGCTLVGYRDTTSTSYEVTRTSTGFLKEIKSLRTGQPVVRYENASGAEGDPPAQPNGVWTIERTLATTIGNGIVKRVVLGSDAMQRPVYYFDGDVTRRLRYHDVDPTNAADGWADGQLERDVLCHNGGAADCYGMGDQTNDAWLNGAHPSPDGGAPSTGCLGVPGNGESILLRFFKLWNGSTDRSMLQIECHKPVVPTSGTSEPKYTISRTSPDGKQLTLLMSNWDALRQFTYGPHNTLVTEQRYNWTPSLTGPSGSLQAANAVGGTSKTITQDTVSPTPGSRFYGRVWRTRQFATLPTEPDAQSIAFAASGLVFPPPDVGPSGTSGDWPWPQDPSVGTQRYREWHNDWNPIGVWQNVAQQYYGINGTDRRSSRIYDVNVLPSAGPGVEPGWVTLVNNERLDWKTTSTPTSGQNGAIYSIGVSLGLVGVQQQAGGRPLRNYQRIKPTAGWSP